MAILVCGYTALGVRRFSTLHCLATFRLVMPCCDFRATLLGGVRSKTNKKKVDKPLKLSPLPQRRFALLIDGDNYSPSYWEAAKAAVAEQGNVVHSHVFAAPRVLANTIWASEMKRLDVTAVPVLRKSGGGKDPNDIAIGMEASRLVFQTKVDSIALVVCDVDYIYLAERLEAWGHKCIVILLEGASAGIAAACEQAKIEVRWIRKADGKTASRPAMKAILNANGESHFEKFSDEDNAKTFPADEKYRAVAHRLFGLGFLHSLDDILLPAIAKFYYTQEIGGLTVWPPGCAITEIDALFAQITSMTWRSNPGDLVFVIPEVGSANATKLTLQKYGSRRCAKVVRGGGPFIMKSSDGMVDLVLRRLGYLDDDLNASFDEAVDTFIERTANYSCFKKLNVSIHSQFDASTKRALLHGAFVSGQHPGHWDVAPSDRLARQWLLSRNMIMNEGAAREEVMRAMHRVARKHNLQKAATYNKMVWILERHISGAVECPTYRRA